MEETLSIRSYDCLFKTSLYQHLPRFFIAATCLLRMKFTKDFLHPWRNICQGFILSALYIHLYANGRTDTLDCSPKRHAWHLHHIPFPKQRRRHISFGYDKFDNTVMSDSFIEGAYIRIFLRSE